MLESRYTHPYSKMLDWKNSEQRIDIPVAETETETDYIYVHIAFGG